MPDFLCYFIKFNSLNLTFLQITFLFKLKTVNQCFNFNIISIYQNFVFVNPLHSYLIFQIEKQILKNDGFKKTIN